MRDLLELVMFYFQSEMYIIPSECKVILHGNQNFIKVETLCKRLCAKFYGTV